MEDLGLVEAIRSECAAFYRREGIVVDLKFDTIPFAISHDIGLCIYRITQEVLRNIAKHAAVAACSVRLR